MIKFSKANILQKLLVNAPIIVLFISVLNEFDFNYLELKYFSFNFPFILIFFWSLKKSESLGYGLIFLAGLFNDVVVGLPIGISSFCYLIICGFAGYLKNITLRPSLLKDWLFFLITIILSLLISLGHNFIGFYTLFYDYLPYFNKFRVPSYILILTHFSILVLASFGFEVLLKKIKIQYLSYCLIFIFLLSIFYFFQ